MRAGIYIVVISLYPGIRIPEYPIIGRQGLWRHINVNRFRPFLQILVRRLNIGRSPAKFADKDNFLAVLGDNRTTSAATAAAQATVPAPPPVNQVSTSIVAKSVLISLVHITKMILTFPVNEKIGIG